MTVAINYVVRWPLTGANRKEPVVTLALRLYSPMNGSHGHWAPQARRRRKERQTAAWALSAPLLEYREGLAKGWLGAVTFTITRIAPRELDDDNLRASAKSVRDGITDALGLKNDRDKRLTWDYSQERGKPKEYAVKITVIGRAC